MFATTQEAFVQALFDPGLPPPPGLTSYTGTGIGKRFDVYRNNVVVSLIGALRARFPAVERIVGEEYFAVAARAFVAGHPPRSRLLMTYGDDFADFLEALTSLAEIPYVPAVARLEAARTRAYHATDAMPLDTQSLRSIEPDRLWQSRLSLHPSFEIVSSRYPLVTIWAMNAGEAEPEPIDLDRPEDALVVRPVQEVHVRTLPPGGAVFLRNLHCGMALGPSAEAASIQAPEFDLVGNLAGLIESGVLTGIRFNDEKEG